MSLLVVGLSHRTAPVSVLERASLTADTKAKLLQDAVAAEPASEAAALATCNRIELYADVDKFHAGVAELSTLLAQHSGVGLEELTPHLYVHYEDRAVHHLFSVACGLDSMVVGEGQILAQIKDALGGAQELNTAGRLINDLFQQALRVGKRAHTETGIDRAGQSLVANRTPERAERLAAATGGRAVPFAAVPRELARADVVISCTGATGLVLDGTVIARAAAARAADGASTPLGLLDLAMPRDIDASAHAVDGVHLVDLETISEAAADAPMATDVDAAKRIVADEVTAFGAAQRAARITPTVVALRTMAADVVAGELARLDGRLPGLDDKSRAEITQTVRRVVDKLLHAPTVRVKQLAGEPGGAGYADALRELFDLDPQTVAAVSRADTGDDPNRGRA